VPIMIMIRVRLALPVTRRPGEPEPLNRHGASDPGRERHPGPDSVVTQGLTLTVARPGGASGLRRRRASDLARRSP
jgi:hypothetical protein